MYFAKYLSKTFRRFKMQSKANIYSFGMRNDHNVEPKVYDGSVFSCDSNLFCDTYRNTTYKNENLTRVKKWISSGYIKGNVRYLIFLLNK